MRGICTKKNQSDISIGAEKFTFSLKPDGQTYRRSDICINRVASLLKRMISAQGLLQKFLQTRLFFNQAGRSLRPSIKDSFDYLFKHIIIVLSIQTHGMLIPDTVGCNCRKCSNYIIPHRYFYVNFKHIDTFLVAMPLYNYKCPSVRMSICLSDSYVLGDTRFSLLLIKVYFLSVDSSHL